eukprot:14609579-Alexandrium_andersonii.AAC.1
MLPQLWPLRRRLFAYRLLLRIHARAVRSTSGRARCLGKSPASRKSLAWPWSPPGGIERPCARQVAGALRRRPGALACG